MAVVIVAYLIPDVLYEQMNIGKYHEIWVDTDTAEEFLKADLSLSTCQEKRRKEAFQRAGELLKEQKQEEKL